jgi:hypothetical protein
MGLLQDCTRFVDACSVSQFEDKDLPIALGEACSNAKYPAAISISPDTLTGSVGLRRVVDRGISMMQDGDTTCSVRNCNSNVLHHSLILMIQDMAMKNESPTYRRYRDRVMAV